MYQLAYVECLRPERADGAPRPHRPRFRIERFGSSRDALDRAREIIGAPTVSAVELYSDAGAIVFDVTGLARELGWPLPPSEPVSWNSLAGSKSINT